jgi:bifunctional non-homologous end joining protein LigD
MRAKREQPYVSLPVKWVELERALKSKKADALVFAPSAALERMAKLGDLFEPVLSLKQQLPDEVVATIERQRRQLKEYSRKRDFSHTIEPMPSLPRRSAQGGRRRFVVQKHAASHLHYDLRLEMHGVLKSWAVPKGPPYTLGVRRLASATEDHPLEYLDFEGIIPQGQYGGGTVMVWDIGTYEIIEGNYYKGSLHVAFAGKKLKGEWRLVRDQQNGPNAWTMEKVGQAMPAVSPKRDDQSALSKRTMVQIAEARDREWQSNRATSAPKRVESAEPTNPGVVLEALPRTKATFIEPMLLLRTDSLPEGSNWQYEVKLDGYRAVAFKARGRLHLRSRNDNDFTLRYPSIATALESLPDETVIDGEIVALDKTGRPSFNVLQN